MTVADHYATVHIPDIYGHVPGLFGLRHAGPGHWYQPLPLRYGDICTACWMRDEQVRPVSSRLCHHGGAP